MNSVAVNKKTSKKTLVIGASVDPSRYSYTAIKRLRSYGYEVVALSKKKGNIDDVEFYTDHRQINDVHTVTLYLSPKHHSRIIDYVLSLKPKRVIFNPGSENIEFSKALKANNINVEFACTLVMLSTGQY